MVYPEKGSLISFKNNTYKIRRIASDFKSVIAVNISTENVIQIPLSEISNVKQENTNDKEVSHGGLETVTEKERKQAEFRYNIIKEFLDEAVDPKKLGKVAETNNVGESTIYAWRKRFLKTGFITSLIDKKGRGGGGKSRLSKDIDEIINDCISIHYLKEKRSITRTYREIKLECKKEGVQTPHLNTLKKRIQQISEETVVGYRRGQKKRKETFDQLTGTIPGAETPYQMVQIDHTLLDIVLVDDEHRKPLGRPWLTVPLDVCTRIPLGMYISLDSPGNYGTGQAIVNALFPKDKILAKFGIDAEWPVWGPIRKLHCDNAGEFHSEMLKMACLQYGITLEFRPIGVPHYGAHIERLMGTFNKELHDLPGTTFSNVHERKHFDYDSKKYAAFTLTEIEEYLTVWITQVYMQRFHKGIGMAPIEKLKQFLVGTPEIPAIGIQPLYEDIDRVKLDFLPFEERTIQNYGVDIDNFRYQSEHLRSFVNMKEAPGQIKNRKKRKFIFKIDPWDLSRIFFFHPDSQSYYDIPLNNRAGYPMNRWEKREVERILKSQGKSINEDAIMKGYKKLKELEEKATKNTKHSRRKDQRKATGEDRKMNYTSNPPPEVEEESKESIDYSTIKTFEVDHESFT